MKVSAMGYHFALEAAGITPQRRSVHVATTQAIHVTIMP
jgi:hypothetical protein